MNETRAFNSQAEADAFLAPRLDRPCQEGVTALAGGVTFTRRVVELGGGAFTNVYETAWRASAASASVALSDAPVTAHAHASATPDCVAVSTGGFFYLIDGSPVAPRALSLNLAIDRGRVRSLPVVDQECLDDRGGALSVSVLPARGALTLDGVALRWAGARTAHEAECEAWGNAVCAIEHHADVRTGKVRRLVDASRFTPRRASSDGRCDLALRARGDGAFVALEARPEGGVDVFGYDLVLRVPRELARADAVVRVTSIGPWHLDEAGFSAISAGPSLMSNLAAHPLHREPCLGSAALLADRPAARLLFVVTRDGTQRLCLFDGRPGSDVFPGVGFEAAAALVRARHDVVAGCFLDSGHTARVVVREETTVTGHGNRHYLRWPSPDDTRFVWSPSAGRATPSLLVVRVRR